MSEEELFESPRNTLGRRTLARPTFLTTRSGRTTTIRVKRKEDKMATFSNEQFERLLSTLSSSGKSSRSGSFTTCNYTYDGRKSSETVEAFLAAVNIFKRAENISDKNALEELPLILKDEAGIWWHGVKNEVTSWAEFQRRIRDSFAPMREAYLIYTEITQNKQGSNDSTESFIRHKRLLFSQLPPPIHNEVQQLDMIYGLLHLQIREKIPRSTINNFDQLLKAARATEQLLKEKGNKEKMQPNNSSENIFKPQTAATKKRCKFCKNLGHSIENCRKKKNVESRPTKEPEMNDTKTVNLATQAPSPSTPKFSCYGCGAPVPAVST